jgi:hypothetical protein
VRASALAVPVEFEESGSRVALPPVWPVNDQLDDRELRRGCYLGGRLSLGASPPEVGREGVAIVEADDLVVNVAEYEGEARPFQRGLPPLCTRAGGGRPRPPSSRSTWRRRRVDASADRLAVLANARCVRYCTDQSVRFPSADWAVRHANGRDSHVVI